MPEIATDEITPMKALKILKLELMRFHTDPIHYMNHRRQLEQLSASVCIIIDLLEKSEEKAESRIIVP